jgi:ankyrin repeat protein
LDRSALLILIIMAAAQWRRDGMDRALDTASQAGNILDMCRLINQGADVYYVLKFMHEGVEKSGSPLNQAALMGHADAVRVLISRNADVSKQSRSHVRDSQHFT